MRRALLSAIAFLLLFSCERLTTPPTPAGVPTGAEYVRATRLWNYEHASGESRTYFEQGQLAMRGHYVQGLKNGLWQSFSTDGEQITAEGEYNLGWHDGATMPMEAWKKRAISGRVFFMGPFDTIIPITAGWRSKAATSAIRRSESGAIIMPTEPWNVLKTMRMAFWTGPSRISIRTVPCITAAFMQTEYDCV